MNKFIFSSLTLLTVSCFSYGFDNVQVINSTGNPVNVALQGSISIGTATINASNPSVGLFNSPIPSSGTAIGAENPSGNLIPFQVDSSSNLKVNCIKAYSGGGSSSSQGGVQADSSSFTLGVSSVTPISGVYENNAAILVATTTAGLRMGPYRNLYVTPLDNNNALFGVSSNPFYVYSTNVATTTISGSVNVSTSDVIITDTSGNHAAITSNALDVYSTNVATVTISGTITTSTHVITDAGSLTSAELAVKNGVGTWNDTGWQTGGSSVPVHEIGTANVNCISGCNGSVTSGPIQIIVGVSTETVGYGAGLSSVPVNVLNTVTVSGTVTTSTHVITDSGSVSQVTQGTIPWEDSVSIRGDSNTVQVSNTVNVNCLSGCSGGAGGSGTASTFDAAFPSSGTAIGFKNSAGNMSWARVDVSSYVDVDVTNTSLAVTASSTSFSAAVYPGLNSVFAVNLRNVNAAPISLGQTTMANSIPVTIASDQTTSTTSITGNVNVTQGTIPWVDSVSIRGDSNTISGTITANQGTAGNSKWPVAAYIDPSSSTIIMSGQVITNLVQIDSVNVVTGGVNGTLGIGGTTASGSSDAGNPVKTGGVAQTTSLPSLVSAGQDVNSFYDKMGRQIVTGIPRDQIQQSTLTITDNTEHVFISSGSTGVFDDLCACTFANTSTTFVRLDLRGQGNGGTVNMTFGLSPQFTTGFMLGCQNSWIQKSSASNWTVQLSASVTDVRISCQYIPIK